MKITAIIQARMGSTRLPGKVLLDVAGHSMLARVVRRVSRARRLDDLIVATSQAASDDAIVEECRRLEVDVFRGNEADVLDRYHQAAVERKAEVVVRITSDCPLIDPGVIDRVIAEFRDVRPDYASNVLRRTWPRGLDTEAITADALARVWTEAQEPYERAHVTPYVYQHPQHFELHSVVQPEDHSDGRWTVDSQADLDFVRAVYQRFDGLDQFTWHHVVQLLREEPSLIELNRHVCQKQVVEG
jgi:spore coat polysaccharide biosynthesis protein SpsF